MILVKMFLQRLLSLEQRRYIESIAVFRRTECRSMATERIKIGVQLQQRLTSNNPAEYFPGSIQRVFVSGAQRFEQRYVLQYHIATVVAHENKRVALALVDFKGGTDSHE